jgi:hypothetical protein
MQRLSDASCTTADPACLLHCKCQQERHKVAHQSSGVAGTLTNDKKSEEVIMPVDSILFSVAAIAVLAFLVAVFLADFQSRSL